MTGNKIWIIELEAELEPLLPTFIENRRRDLGKLRTWTKNNNFDDIKRLGHYLQGPPGAFGFNYLVSLGREMESAALQKDLQNLDTIADKFENFMNHHHINVKAC